MPSAASAAQREAERLASLTFFLDHQIGRYIVAKMLRAAGARVEVHLDHFPGNKPDLEWIPEVGRRGWVLITKDQHIRRNPLERAAYGAAKLRGFVVTGKDMSGNELADLLVRCLDGMVRRAAGRNGPLLFTISRVATFKKLNLSKCWILCAGPPRPSGWRESRKRSSKLIPPRRSKRPPPSP